MSEIFIEEQFSRAMFAALVKEVEEEEAVS
jgi:hypothetical protein